MCIHGINFKQKFICANCFSLLSAPFSLPKIFGDGMVLQAAPDRAQVWGYLGGVTLSVTINIKCLSGYARQYTALNVRTKMFFGCHQQSLKLVYLLLLIHLPPVTSY
jgi:hypothetical protein